MKTFTIAVIAGDGVGTEVVPEAKRVLEAVGAKHNLSFVFQDFDWGSDHFFRWGRMMPAGAIDLLQPCDAILLGAVGHPDIPDHTTLNGLLLPIRRAFDLYANVRPAYLYPGVQSPLAKPKGGDIDFVVVRENTEGNTPRSAASFIINSPTRSPFRPPFSPAAASSASCASPSNSRSSGTRKSASPPSPNPTRKASAWCFGTASFAKWPRSSPTSKPNRCWSTPPP